VFSGDGDGKNFKKFLGGQPYNTSVIFMVVFFIAN